MQIDTIQETEDDQVYRMHLTDHFSIIFKIIGPNSAEWINNQTNNIYNIYIYFQEEGTFYDRLIGFQSCSIADRH